jgi:hypothetical protein
MNNQICVIQPYRKAGGWAFDDFDVGLVAEPFVCGTNEMIDFLVRDIPKADAGFRLLFSANPFSGYQQVARRLRPEADSWWYATDEPPMEGWLCKALFKYFKTAPRQLFVKAEAL